MIMKDRFTSFLFIWLFVFIVLFSLPHGACADGGMSGNLNTRGQAPVAVIDSLTAATNRSYTITSKTEAPSYKQSICIEAYHQSTITGISDIQAGYATLTATLKNTSPEAIAQLKWYIEGGDAPVQVGGGSYVFSAAGKTTGKYKVEAKLNGSIKAINIYVVNCSYFLAVEKTSSGYPFEISSDAIYSLNFVGHASWQLHINPSDASKAIPFRQTTYYINKFIGFHANDYTVIGTGVSLSPKPTINVPDTITPVVLKQYPVAIDNFLSMLEDTKMKYLVPGNYFLGTDAHAENTSGTISFTWHHSASRNCVSMALMIGNSHGLMGVLPSGSGTSHYRMGCFVIDFSGDAPCYL